MKKIIALVLVLTMAVGILAGCVKVEPPTTTKPTQGNNGETQPTTEAGLREVTVSILGIDRAAIPNLTTGGEWVNTAAGAALKEMLDANKINLEFKWINFDNNTYKNTVSTRVGTGVDLADIIFVEAYQDMAVTWGNYGFTQDLLPLIEKYDTDGSIKQFYYDNGAGSVWEQSITEDGKLYYLPGIASVPGAVTSDGEEIPFASGCGFIVRADWLKALNMEIKEVYTPDELITIVKAMRDADANGDGKNNEYIYSKVMSSDYSGIAYAFHMSPWNIGYFGDTQAKTVFASNNFTSPYFADYVKWLQDAIAAGVFNADYLAGQYPRDNSAEAVAWENNGLGYVKENYVPIKVDVNGTTAGSYQQLYGYTASTGVQYAISSSCKDLEGAIRLMDVLCTKEYSMLHNYGAEGIGHEMVNGVPMSKHDWNDTNTWALTNVIWGCFPQHNVIKPGIMTDFSEADPDVYTDIENRQESADRMVKFMKDDLANVYTSVGAWPVHDQAQKDIIDTYEGQLRTAMSEYFIKFVMGELDVEKDMPAVLKDLEENYHMSEVIEANLTTLAKMYEVVERP